MKEIKKDGKEGFSWTEKAKAEDKLWQFIQKIVDDMHARGYEFEIENDPGRNEIAVKFPVGKYQTRVAHFMATPQITLQKDGEKSTYPLEEAIKARISNPDGNLWDTLHSEKFQSEEFKEMKKQTS